MAARCGTGLSRVMRGQSQLSVIGSRPNGLGDDNMNGDRENMICDVPDGGRQWDNC